MLSAAEVFMLTKVSKVGIHSTTKHYNQTSKHVVHRELMGEWTLALSHVFRC